MQPEKSCPDRFRSSRGSRSAAWGGPGYGATGAGPGLAMDGVTAATMRSEGAAPRRAARYGALSLVLATLLGQGKAGSDRDCRVPQWAAGKLGRGWRGWREIRVPP